MIKRLFLLSLISILTLSMTTSCREKVKTTKGVINMLSIRYMDAMIDGHTIRFDLKDAKYPNGAIMMSDSVSIEYLGDLTDEEARAITVTLIPKPGHVVSTTPDPTKPLETADATPEEQKASADFLRVSKKHGH